MNRKDLEGLLLTGGIIALVGVALAIKVVVSWYLPDDLASAVMLVVIGLAVAGYADDKLRVEV